MRERVTRDVSARGARIRFVEAGSGPPLVLLHDALATRDSWSAAIDLLADTFRVIAPDLPGFGESEKPEPERYAYGYDAFADSILDLVAALDLGRVHVVGHAMGGGVALTMAAKHRSVVHKLVLASALVFPVDEPAIERAARVPLAGALLWRQLMGRPLFRAAALASVYSGAARPDDARIDAMYEAFNAPAARRAAHATVVAKGDTRPLVARLPRISAEALVVWGRDDQLAPIDHGRRLARELHARLEVLECGRCPAEELPASFAATVTSFLAPPARAAARERRSQPPTTD